MTPMTSPPSKLFAVTLLIIAVALLTLWFGMGVGGTIAAPVVLMPETAQVQRTGQSSDGLESARPVPEAKIQTREKIEDVGPMREGILMGRVFDPEGNPVAGAMVALSVLDLAGPSKELSVSTNTNADGVFTLDPSIAMRDRELVLIASYQGFRPASARFRRDSSVPKQDLELHLERGHAIEGWVVSQGEPVAGVSVSAELSPKDAAELGWHAQSGWIDGRHETRRSRSKTNHDGRFVLTGLGPYEHQLRIGVDSKGLELGYQQKVEAPAAGLVIDITPAEIEVTVRRAGRLISGVWILADCGKRHLEVLSNKSEPTLLQVTPGKFVDLSFHDDRSEAFEQTVLAPARGARLDVAVNLTVVERPSLQIHIPGATDQGIDRIEARLIGERRNTFRDTSRLLMPSAERDRFLWAAVPLPPGPYRLVVGPRDSTSSRYLIEVSAEIELPAVGQIEAAVGLNLGGHFELNMVPIRMKDSKIRAWLQDASGSKVWEKFWEYSDGALWNTAFGSAGSWSSHRKPAPLAHKHQESKSKALAPGPYRLQIEADGGGVVDREVEIRAGETTKEHIQL